MNVELAKKRKPFKFTNVVATKDEFKARLEEYWK